MVGARRPSRVGAARSPLSRRRAGAGSEALPLGGGPGRRPPLGVFPALQASPDLTVDGARSCAADACGSESPLVARATALAPSRRRSRRRSLRASGQSR